ncbi:MAG: hypothetical protein RL238_1357 [Actinomycetota bacterium]
MFRRTMAALLPLAATAVLLAPSSPTAHADDDGLTFETTTTYTIDAAASVVRVVADLTLTNTLPDQVKGNIINRRYFGGVSFPVPAGAQNFVASSSSGRALRATSRAVPGTDAYVIYDIDLASNLFYRQTQRVRVTYDITGLPPRSESPWRVNPAYAAFDAFGVGDDGRVTVRVVVPPGFVVDALGSDAVQTAENGNTVYTATDIPNPDEFDIFISARNDGALTSTAVATDDGDEFDVRAWPGDTEWQAFVTTQIDDGVPALAELIGQPWPIDESVEVRQAYTPYLYGYAGWFSASDKEIEIGEDLEQEVVLHELSHAWFSDDWFGDRWLSEGFAQVYSNKAVAELGGDVVEPVTIDDTDPGRVALNEWGDPNFVEGADEVEAYGYNAAYDVVQRIVDEVGDDTMRTVFAAVADRTIAYVGDAEPEEIGRPTDWRRFLDLVEELGGSTEARDLIEQYVATDSQLDMLEERDAARERYADLTEHGDEWAPPFEVRERMNLWAFPQADERIDEAEAVLDLRDELDDKATELGADYPTTFEAGYEAADGDELPGVGEAVQEQIDTADEVLAAVAAEAADDGFFGTIGLWGTDLPAEVEVATAAFEQGDHDTARAAAQSVVDTVDEAGSVGTKRFAFTLGGLVLFVGSIVLVVVLVRRRRRPEPEPDTETEVEPEADDPTPQ